MDVPGELDLASLQRFSSLDGFAVESYRLELLGHCNRCA
jgi:hypothetical protein